MLLRVLGPPSGLCIALARPEFPEVAHSGPSLNWSGGAHPIRELLIRPFVLCVGLPTENRKCINFKFVVLELNIYLRYIKARL